MEMIFGVAGGGTGLALAPVLIGVASHRGAPIAAEGRTKGAEGAHAGDSVGVPLLEDLEHISPVVNSAADAPPGSLLHALGAWVEATESTRYPAAGSCSVCLGWAWAALGALGLTARIVMSVDCKGQGALFFFRSRSAQWSRWNTRVP